MKGNGNREVWPTEKVECETRGWLTTCAILPARLPKALGMVMALRDDVDGYLILHPDLVARRARDLAAQGLPEGGSADCAGAVADTPPFDPSAAALVFGSPDQRIAAVAAAQRVPSPQGLPEGTK